MNVSANLWSMATLGFPYGIVMLWGVWLCSRRGDRRPHGARWVRAALALIVVGAGVQFYLPSILSGWVQTLYSGNLFAQWMLVSLLKLPYVLALACLFWAVFGDVPPADPRDVEPPVFRYDDGSKAPTR